MLSQSHSSSAKSSLEAGATTKLVLLEMKLPAQAQGTVRLLAPGSFARVSPCQVSYLLQQPAMAPCFQRSLIQITNAAAEGSVNWPGSLWQLRSGGQQGCRTAAMDVLARNPNPSL